MEIIIPILCNNTFSKTSRDIKDSHNHKGKMHDPKKIMLDLSKAHINEKQHLRLPLTTSRLRLKVPIKQASKVCRHRHRLI